jgi:hypothetical protein
LIVVPRPFPAAPLVVRCRYLIVSPKPLPAAPGAFAAGKELPRHDQRRLVVIKKARRHAGWQNPENYIRPISIFF